MKEHKRVEEILCAFGAGLEIWDGAHTHTQRKADKELEVKTHLSPKENSFTFAFYMHFNILIVLSFKLLVRSL